MAKRRKFSSEPFGTAIERLMNESGTTYRGLAAKTGLSAGYLNHLVHGNRPVPSNEVVERLAEALDVEPEHFREYRLRVITAPARGDAGPRRPPLSPPERLSRQRPAAPPGPAPIRCALRHRGVAQPG